MMFEEWGEVKRLTEKNNRRKRYLAIELVDKFGKFNQFGKAIEEMEELIVELKKMMGGKNAGDLEPYLNELADVEIMISQLVYMAPDHPYQKMLEKKLNKAESYLDE